MAIELPPGVEMDAPEKKAEAPSPMVELKVTYDEAKGLWVNGPVDGEALCDLMFKRAKFLPLNALTYGRAEPGVHVLAIRMDKSNPDPVTAFSVELSSSLAGHFSALELESFVDWMVKKGEQSVAMHQAIAAQKNHQQGVQHATPGMLAGLRFPNGRK